MGIQDRDYYREKPKQASKGSGVKFLLYPVMTIGALWYGADVFLKYQASGKLVALPPLLSDPFLPAMPSSPAKSHAAEPISGGIVLKTDRQGHFRGTVLINDVAMPFLIDTGATATTIPEKMAFAANLPFGRSIETSTAGGKVFDRQTQINSLRIGNAEIRKLNAHINRHLDEVLIGMNTLKYFRMAQSGNTLTLVANNQANGAGQALTVNDDSVASSQPIKKPTIIKKTLICDSRQVCTTKYSDH